LYPADNGSFNGGREPVAEVCQPQVFNNDRSNIGLTLSHLVQFVRFRLVQGRFCGVDVFDVGRDGHWVRLADSK